METIVVNNIVIFLVGFIVGLIISLIIYLLVHSIYDRTKRLERIEEVLKLKEME